MRILVFLPLLAFAICSGLRAEESAASERTAENSVTTAYLSDKADADAIESGVLEVVEENAENAAETATDESGSLNVKDEQDSTIPRSLIGPAEIAAGVILPAIFVTLGAVSAPYCIVKGLFDTLTLGCFADETSNRLDEAVTEAAGIGAPAMGKLGSADSTAAGR